MYKAYFRKEDHKYFVDEAMTKEVPSVSSILEHFGYSNFDELRRMGMGHIIDAAADYGNVVHDTLRLHDENELDSYDEKISGEVEAWKKFISDYRPEFLLIEEPLISKVWGFGGTPDRYWIEILADIKTGQKSIAHEIQTALYKILIEENFPFSVKQRMTVEVKPDGYRIIPHKNRNDDSIAKAMLQIFHHKRKVGLIK